jgi:hypothetical protein
MAHQLFKLLYRRIHRASHFDFPSALDFIDLTHWFRSWPLLTWYMSLCRGTPARFAKARRDSLSPTSVVTKIVARLLSCCSSCVAHRQLLNEYPRKASFLSRLSRFGLFPISARKFSNFRQRLQTVMPRPPYIPYLVAFGLLHLSFMLFQDVYSRGKRILRRARSCGTKALSNFSCFAFGPLATHPQLRDWPCVMVYPRIVLDVPQSHLHSQRVAPPGPFSRLSITRSLPNLWPERSRNGIGMSVSPSRMNS